MQSESYLDLLLRTRKQSRAQNATYRDRPQTAYQTDCEGLALDATNDQV